MSRLHNLHVLFCVCLVSLFLLFWWCADLINDRNFDRSLLSRNPEWGIRNLEDVIDVAKKEGLEFVKSVEMPANNLSVLFCKA